MLMETGMPPCTENLSKTKESTTDSGSSRREFLSQSGKIAAGVGVAALLGNLGNYALSYAAGGPPIKIGVLHSLSGTMAISEVSLRDVVLMAVEEINKAGGVMGREIQPGKV
jgi:urea transport system substrate-binding protein